MILMTMDLLLHKTIGLGIKCSLVNVFSCELQLDSC